LQKEGGDKQRNRRTLP